MNFRLYILLFILVFQSCKSQTKKINGLSFVASPDKINHTHISPVKKVSANYVALMPFGFLKELSSSKIIHNTNRQWFGETQEGLEQYAKEFQKNNIKIMIKPQIWVWNGHYTGKIEMTSEEKWFELEKSYSEFILTYVKSAETLKADIFCIGTELERFVENRPKFWQELIQKIRRIYSGKLTYASNWDEFKRVPFWQQLDYIGVDAYFPLSDKKKPTIEDFEKGWLPHKHEIIKIQQEKNKPILFTEFGYRSVNFTGREPWDSNRNLDEVNLENQTKALQAIYNQFWNEEWFAGGFLWKWFQEYGKVGGENNNMFTLQNKPAEKLLKELYEK